MYFFFEKKRNTKKRKTKKRKIQKKKKNKKTNKKKETKKTNKKTNKKKMGFRLGNFVHTENGRAIMSILLGFGLATLFRSVCKGHHCYMFHSAPTNEIQDKIFKFEDKCYKYHLRNASCATKSGQKMVPI